MATLLFRFLQLDQNACLVGSILLVDANSGHGSPVQLFGDFALGSEPLPDKCMSVLLFNKEPILNEEWAIIIGQVQDIR